MAEPQINTGTSLDSVTSGIYGEAWKSAEKFDKQTDEGIKKMESETVPKPPELKEAPNPKDFSTDSMQTFGSAAMFLATFGSLLTKAPLKNALNSGAAVMNAVNAKDAGAFKQAMDKYKIDTDNAWKMADYNQQLYKDVLGKDEAELKARAVSAKDNVMIHMADAKMATKLYEDRQKNVDKLEKHQLITDAAEADRQAAIDSGKSEQEANKIYMESYGKYSATMAGKLAKDDQGLGVDWGKIQPKDPIPGTGLTAGAVKIYGEAIVNGAKPSQIGLGYGMNPVKKAVDNYIAEKHPDFDMAKAELGYQGKQTAEKLSAKNYENMKIAGGNLDRSVPTLLESAKKVDLSKFKDINSFLNYAKTHTGDPNIVTLATKLAATRADYSLVLARGGNLTDTSRNHADEVLNLAFSEGQMQAATDAMMIETKNNMASATDALQSVNDLGKTAGLAGKPPDEKHLKMLADDPSDENKKYFDEAFGEGAAAKALGQ